MWADVAIAGTSAPAAEWNAALCRVFELEVAPPARGELQWTELPDGVRRAKLDELAKVLGTTVHVVEVAMQLGGRGAGLSARRYDLPARQEEIDLTAEARGILYDWDGRAFDEHDAVLDLAWALLSDDLDSEPPSSTSASHSSIPPKWTRRRTTKTRRPSPGSKAPRTIRRPRAGERS
jgi:hypothetical protein